MRIGQADFENDCTAGWTVPEQLRGLLEYVNIDRIVYGSDWPWTPAPAVKLSADYHERYLPDLLSEEDQEKLYHKNAFKLLK